MNPEDMDELEAMLPEYVNQTLSDADAKRMKKAIENSERLKGLYAEELRMQQRIKQELNNIVDRSKQSEEARLEALMEKIQASKEVTSDSDKIDTQQSKLTNALSILNPKRWHPAIALSLAIAIPAQAAIISGQAVTIASLEDENFRLASGPCKEADTNNAIMLEFSKNANWQDIAQLLDMQKLVIIERGSFGVLSVSSKNEEDALNAQIEELKTSPLIVSAEAIQ